MEISPDRGEPKAAITCRLCGGEARLYGGRSVLGKYEVAYYECGQCGSLQTEEPYWLEEAYRVEGLGLHLFAQHQKDSFRYAEEDFKKLTRAAGKGELP